ncbi:MAG: hypothetical protein D4R74_12390 [Betaproteobacteria bacterium]|nr:MAG: hypothetical protein D4R74_12390 [Betaproteobacteria bacterium]
MKTKKVVVIWSAGAFALSAASFVLAVPGVTNNDEASKHCAAHPVVQKAFKAQKSVKDRTANNLQNKCWGYFSNQLKKPQEGFNNCKGAQDAYVRNTGRKEGHDRAIANCQANFKKETAAIPEWPGH